MSEPRRWKDSPNAPVGMRELLGSATRSRPLEEATFRKGAERLGRASVAPAAIAAVSIWSKLAAAGAIGLAATTAVVVVEVRRDPAPTTAVVVPAVHASNAVAAVAPSVPVPSVVVKEESESAPSPAEQLPDSHSQVAPAIRVSKVETTAPDPTPPWVPDEPPRPKSSLPDELPLLEAARSQMARSPETALTRLAEHRARHPFGILAAERDLMELDALRRVGRLQDARDRAHAWLGRDPSGIHSARVRAILAALE